MKGGQDENGRLTHTRLRLAHDVNSQDSLKNTRRNHKINKEKGEEEKVRKTGGEKATKNIPGTVSDTWYLIRTPQVRPQVRVLSYHSSGTI